MSKKNAEPKPKKKKKVFAIGDLVKTEYGHSGKLIAINLPDEAEVEVHDYGIKEDIEYCSYSRLKNGSKDALSKRQLRENIDNCLGIDTDEELIFSPDVKRWRLDVIIPEHKIAIEIEGGTYTEGRHTKGVGYRDDMRKYNEAVRLGWKLIRVTPQQVNSNYVINLITDLIWKDTTSSTLKASASGSGTSKKK